MLTALTLTLLPAPAGGWPIVGLHWHGKAIGESTERPRALLAERLLSSAPLAALRCWLGCWPRCWSRPLSGCALRRAAAAAIGAITAHRRTTPAEPPLSLVLLAASRCWLRCCWMRCCWRQLSACGGPAACRLA